MRSSGGVLVWYKCDECVCQEQDNGGGPCSELHQAKGPFHEPYEGHVRFDIGLFNWPVGLDWFEGCGGALISK